MNNYYDDYEVCTCTTKIKEEKDGYYAFEDTIFYGEKGGMLADQATINQLPVIDLKWEGEELYHIMKNRVFLFHRSVYSLITSGMRSAARRSAKKI